MDMAEHMQDLGFFVNRMRIKIFKSSHKHKNDNMSFKDVKDHLIDEILEMFIVKSKSDEILVRRILSECSLDTDESIDVANMCWILDFFIRRGIK